MSWLVAWVSGHNSRGKPSVRISCKIVVGAPPHLLRQARTGRVARCTTQTTTSAITSTSKPLAPQRIDQHLARQRLAQLQRLGHLDQRDATPLHTGHRLHQGGHPHRAVAVRGIVKIHQGRVGRLQAAPCPVHNGKSS